MCATDGGKVVGVVDKKKRESPNVRLVREYNRIIF